MNLKGKLPNCIDYTYFGHWFMSIKFSKIYLFNIFIGGAPKISAPKTNITKLC